MENLIKMDDLGGFTPIFGNIHISTSTIHVGEYTIPMDPSWVPWFFEACPETASVEDRMKLAIAGART